MSNATLTIRTDAKTKKQIADFAASIGLSTNSFIMAASMQAVRDRRIELEPAFEPTPYLEKIMREAETDYRHDRNITHTHGRKEALTHLDSLTKK